MPRIPFAAPLCPQQALLLNISAFALWASATLLFKLLTHLPVWEVFAYRVIGSLGWCMLFLALSGVLGQAWQILRSPRQLGLLLLSSGLIACNWFLVIWAVANDRLLDASLGYYLSPLLSVLLAHWLFREASGRREWLASALCLAGVILIMAGEQNLQIPWIGLTIAATFALYSAVKKRSTVSPLLGLGLETTLAAIPASALLLYSSFNAGAALSYSHLDWVLLLVLGLITTLPMWLYIASAKVLSLTTLGFLQYLNPTLMFLLAVLLFGETVSTLKLTGFSLIWCALLGLLLSRALSTWQHKPQALPQTTRVV
ncbi:EamA family transporter RarD [Pseudomonas anguilliseptica]|uniref:EamA family transporter RarD n=1 Tax=Pseudomonas anguilliseptica TaxID=53406 RepID=UPI0022B050E2|nr:EamA family transporter RarD [Pseudomonas anguilliseptica]MCZ4324348.1 EamA family transporter RarD [Pseudomonas anguilliseptica]